MAGATLEATPVSDLRGVGPALAEKLASAGVETVLDALLHLPLRYEDRRKLWALSDVHPGMAVLVEGAVQHAEVRFGRRRSLIVSISDGSGLLWLRLFHFSRAQQAQFATGNRVRCFGTVRAGPQALEMVHPEYRRVDDNAPPPEGDTLTPVYGNTDGIGPAGWRRIIDAALERLDSNPITELLPEAIRDRSDSPPLATALRTLHRPEQIPDLDALLRHPAVARAALEELTAQQLGMLKLRARQRQGQSTVLTDQALANTLIATLPFALTGAQRRVLGEIHADLAQPTPMLRLVQGDVGSGKTVVAASAALTAIGSGLQAVLMAPTELLAEQHALTLDALLAPLGIRIGFLGGKAPAAERRAALTALADGSTQLAIGTHALFQADVDFHQLGLVIIDEQHRFGVHQRLALRDKGAANGQVPHQLVMTATPIPRTLAQTAYADLDLSVIDELPAGRQPVVTRALPAGRRDEVIERIRAACQSGRQVYWVCTLIEESESLQAEAAEGTAEQLGRTLTGIPVGLVHSRVGDAERKQTMAAFKEGQLRVLVATTVIEVGVDVPNASLMIIENAERLGLAQLHQLRGRVGRGSEQSHCLLLYQPKLSERAERRLAAMRETNDGFEIARRDLELRGPGELLGAKQSGLVRFRIADLARDRDLLALASEAARQLIDSAEGEALLRRWRVEADQYREA